MYSKFSGRDFIVDYFDNRSKFLECAFQKISRENIFGISIEKLKDCPNIFESRWPITIQKIIKFKYCINIDLIEKTISQAKIDCEVLSQYLILFLISHPKPEKRIYMLLNIFLKKYEVFKKIFTLYNQQFRKVNDDYKNLNIYINFVFCFLYYFQITGNLKFLNSSLKINDMLCNSYNDIKTPEQLLLFVINIKMETDCIGNLSKDIL